MNGSDLKSWREIDVDRSGARRKPSYWENADRMATRWLMLGNKAKKLGEIRKDSDVLGDFRHKSQSIRRGWRRMDFVG